MIVFFVKCLAFLKTYPIFAVEKKRMTVFSVRTKIEVLYGCFYHIPHRDN